MGQTQGKLFENSEAPDPRIEDPDRLVVHQQQILLSPSRRMGGLRPRPFPHPMDQAGWDMAERTLFHNWSFPKPVLAENSTGSASPPRARRSASLLFARSP